MVVVLGNMLDTVWNISANYLIIKSCSVEFIDDWEVPLESVFGPVPTKPVNKSPIVLDFGGV